MNKKFLLILFIVIILILIISYFFFKNFQENIESNLTAEEMAEKINIALREKRYDYLWNRLHPDDQSYWGNEKAFKEIAGDWNELGLGLDLNFWEQNRVFLEDSEEKQVEILESWQHPITNKKYYQVTEVPTILPSDENWSSITLIHLQKIKGSWKCFTEIDKESVKKFILTTQFQFQPGETLERIQTGEIHEYLKDVANESFDDMKETYNMMRDNQIISSMGSALVRMRSIYESSGNYDDFNLKDKKVSEIANEILKRGSKLIIKHDNSVNSQKVCLYIKLFKKDNYWWCAESYYKFGGINKSGATINDPSVTCNDVNTICPTLTIEQ